MGYVKCLKIGNFPVYTGLLPREFIHRIGDGMAALSCRWMLGMHRISALRSATLLAKYKLMSETLISASIVLQNYKMFSWLVTQSQDIQNVKQYFASSIRSANAPYVTIFIDDFHLKDHCLIFPY